METGRQLDVDHGRDGAGVEPGNQIFVGIDVGAYSVGCAAIEVDSARRPVRLLNVQSYIHDAGVLDAKTGTSRKAKRGEARRRRTLLRSRRRRLDTLDRFLTKHGYPEASGVSFPYEGWMARAALADATVDDPVERDRLIAVAVRHMARHRGFRSTWEPVDDLKKPVEDSEVFVRFRERCETLADKPSGAFEGLTAAQMVRQLAHRHSIAVRSTSEEKNAKRRQKEQTTALLEEVLHQTDLANELHRIADTQNLNPDFVEPLIETLFWHENPRKGIAALIGHDCLPGQEHLLRASRASVAYQQFRIADVLGNIRVTNPSGTKRSLTTSEMEKAFDLLNGWTDPANKPTWDDVATTIGVNADDLAGSAAETGDVGRTRTRPPYNTTHARMSSDPTFKTIWPGLDDPVRDLLAEYSISGALPTEDSDAGIKALNILETLGDKATSLEDARLESGRSPYSVASLNRLTARILAVGCDLHAARQDEFGVSNTWSPPPVPIDERVGHPGVDRTLKRVARWLRAVEAEFGPPDRVTIEHTRDGFRSAKVAKEIKQNQTRSSINETHEQAIRTERKLKPGDKVTQADKKRYRAIERQNCQCLACGTKIGFLTCEIDHIVPRKGIGSNNADHNLAALCHSCNQSKSNELFSTWIASRPDLKIDDVTTRIANLNNLYGNQARLKNGKFKDLRHRRLVEQMTARVTRTSLEPPIDARSGESEAWMARELARRVKGTYPQTNVNVFRGQITGIARAAGKLEKKIPYIGSEHKPGKTRFDRRHHAVDAAVIALMRPKVAETLVLRTAMRDEANILGDTSRSWKTFDGADHDAKHIYRRWLHHMDILANLLTTQFELDDGIPVTRDLRLKVGGPLHDETIHKLETIPLRSALTVAQIDRAATPSLYLALRNQPDFNPKTGLPENPHRTLTFPNYTITANQTIELLPKGSNGSNALAAVKVRSGYAKLGTTVHHMRIFRIDKPGKTSSYLMMRVFQVDLQQAFKNRLDLFEVPIADHTISARAAGTTLRNALGGTAPSKVGGTYGTATYVGWIVRGDEIELQQPFSEGVFDSLFSETRWIITGTAGPDRVRLKPAMLSPEGVPNLGLTPDTAKAVHDIATKRTVSVNPLFQAGLTVVRRNVLGKPYPIGAGHPPTWSTEP